MGGILVLFFIQNVLIFSIIFWLLTFLGEYFFKGKNHKTKKNFYECGFKSVNDIDLQFNFNFLIICVFLVLYDIEFILMMPFLVNLYYVNFFSLIVFLTFFILIIISLLYDWQANALNWQL